jgi:hypothetical protein
MAQSNENADPKNNNNGGGSGNGAGTGNNSGNGGNGSTTTLRDPVIDIKKYLQKAKLGKSAADLMEVLFKGKTFKASEWPGKVKEALDRPVRK